MRSFTQLLVFLLSLLLLASSVDALRRLRRMKSYPRRNEARPIFCQPHEHHVRCGPEPHCEKSCENLFSPPYCIQSDNEKCFYPRCICDEGFVRDENGGCIRPRSCPFVGDDDNLVEELQFRHHPRHKKHNKTPKEYFW